MKTSQRGLEFIAELEGCKLEAYLCPAKVWTIGVGHTKGVKEGDKITKEQAISLLKKDVNIAEKTINKFVLIQLNQNQFDALVSFVFNVGAKAFKHSTLLKFLNANHIPLAAGQFDRWNKVKGKVCKGLINRRKKEKELFLKEG